MTEAANICRAATEILRQGHFTHPHYHRIGLAGIQGVEAVLTILQEGYGFSYPGGLFLAAVDVMLEKAPVVRAVKEQLQRCRELATAEEQQQQEQPEHAAEGGSECSSQRQQPSCDSRDEPAGSNNCAHDEHDSHADDQRAGHAATLAPAAHAGAAAEGGTPPAASAQPAWTLDGPPADVADPAAAQACSSSRSSSKSPAEASTAFHTVSRSSTPATPTAGGAGALGHATNPVGSAVGEGKSPAAAPDSGGNPVLSPASAASPYIQGPASRLSQKQGLQQQQQGPQQQQSRSMQQRQQHQQLQHLLFDAPSEVFTASLAGSMRHIDLLSAVNSPQQLQAQQELQQELSRSSCASAGARPRHKPIVQQGQQQEREEQQQWQSAQTEQQPMLLQPQRAQEQQQLQQTLQFARQPVPLEQQQQQQQLPSQVSTWQQWQQQQQLAAAKAAVSEPSPWRRQQELQQQEQHFSPSPLAVPQPKHKQPALSPPVLPPHTASPAVTPMPLAWPLQQQAPGLSPAHTQAGQQQQLQHNSNQQQPQRRGPSPQQLQDLRDLAGMLQPVLYDDTAASEVLSEWLSGSDVALADSEGGSDAAGPGLQRPIMQAAPLVAAYPLQQPSSAASTAGLTVAGVPPVVPQVLQFTPVAAAAAPAPWPAWQGAAYSDSMGQGPGGVQYVSPASGGARATPTAAARLQQQWSQQGGTPGATGGPQGSYRGAGSSLAGPHSAGRTAALTPPNSQQQQQHQQQPALSPGSSVAVREAAAEAGDDGQSLVLDIDLAKVINSSSAAGTIVLQVRRDETGALSAAAALAPTPKADGALAGVAGDLLASAGPLAASSPVLGGKAGASAAGRQGLAFGSISVGAGSSLGTGAGAGAAGVPCEAEGGGDRPVHRVLRYSAEGRVSIGSGLSHLGGAAAAADPADASAAGSAAAAQLAGEEGGDAAQHVQGWADGGELHLVTVPRQRQLGDASWVLLDLQPGSQELGPSSPQAASRTDASQQQQQQQHVDAHAYEHAGPAAAAAPAKGEGQPGGADLAAAGLPGQGAAASSNGELLPAQHGPQEWPLQQQQQHQMQQFVPMQPQGPRTQRVSLEPPSTPLAGSVAGTPPNSRQPFGLTGAGQASLWAVGDDAATPGGASGEASDGLGGGFSGEAEAATPVPAGTGQAAGGANQGVDWAVGGADTATVSPLPPELVSTETPAGFKFWGAGPRGPAAAAAGTGGGLRYDAAQQHSTMDSLSSNWVTSAPEAAAGAAAAGVQEAAAEGAAATRQQPQQQQQLGFLGQSLELLGPDSRGLLAQLGLGQVSMELLQAGNMHSLELQMLQALGAAAPAAGATGAGDLSVAQQLAVSAVKLLRRSVAAAAVAAAKQHAADPTSLPAPVLEEEAAGLCGTRAYQSLDLLPRQLLQSLTAAALAEAGREGAGSQEAAGSQMQQLGPGSAAAAAATGTPLAGAEQQQQQQQRQDLTSWLADRFGAEAGLQQSVSVLLQELEQQHTQQAQPQQQQLPAAVPCKGAVEALTAPAPDSSNAASHADVCGAAADDSLAAVAEAADLAAAPQQQQGQQQGQQPAAASAYASWSNRVEQLLQGGQAPGPDGLLPVLTEGSLRMTPSPSGWGLYGPRPGEDGPAGNSAAAVGCAEGAPAVAAAAAGVVAVGEDGSLPSLFRTSVMTNPLYWVEQSAADFAAGDDGAAEPAAADGELAADGSLTAADGGEVQRAESGSPQATAVAGVSEVLWVPAGKGAGDEAQHSAAPMGAAGWPAPAPAAAGADVALQDSEAAAAVMQQYLPYCSSDGGASPCSSRSSSSLTGTPVHQAHHEGRVSLDLQHQQQQQQHSHEEPGSHSTAPLGKLPAVAAGAAADTRASSAAGSSHHGELPALVAADSGDVGMLPLSSRSKEHPADAHQAAGAPLPALSGSSGASGRGSRLAELTCSGLDGAAGPEDAASLGTGGPQAALASPASSCSSRRRPGAASRSPASPNARLVVRARLREGAGGSGAAEWGVVESPAAQAGAEGCQASTAAAVVGSDKPQAQEWHQQPPRWQVVSELGWPQQQASEHGEDTGDALQQQLGECSELESEPHLQGWGVSAHQVRAHLPAAAQQQNAQEQQPEPHSVSRIQHLMQKLRARRKLLNPDSDSGLLQEPAAAAAEGHVPALHAQPQLGGPSQGPWPAVQALSPSQGSSAQGEWGPASPADAGRAAAVAAEPFTAAGGEQGGEGAAAGSPGAACSAAEVTASPAQSVGSSSSRPPGESQQGGDMATEDPLAAAEAAMQQALQRIQLLHLEHQPAPPGQQEDAAGPWQQQQQLLPPQVTAGLQQGGDQVQGELQQPNRPVTAAPAMPAVASMPQEQGQGVLVGVVAAHGSAAAAERHQATADYVAAAPAAAGGGAAAAGRGGAESPSVQWVRRVLQDNSALSSYVQALADGGSSQARAAVQEAGAQADAASSSPPTTGGDRPDLDSSSTADGFREQVASRMSALLAAAQHRGGLSDSCCSSRSGAGSRGSTSGAHSSCDAEQLADQRQSAHEADAAHGPSAWQDKIQLLLAAADAAADTLAQPPELQQRQQLPAAGAKAVASKAAALTGQSRAASGRAAAPPRSSGLRRAAAGAGSRSSSAAQSTRGAAPQRSSKPSKVAAAAAAIVAARHSHAAAVAAAAQAEPAPGTGAQQGKLPTPVSSHVQLSDAAGGAASAGPSRSSCQAAAKSRAAPSTTARPSKLQKRVCAGQANAAPAAAAGAQHADTAAGITRQGQQDPSAEQQRRPSALDGAAQQQQQQQQQPECGATASTHQQPPRAHDKPAATPQQAAPAAAGVARQPQKGPPCAAAPASAQQGQGPGQLPRPSQQRAQSLPPPPPPRPQQQSVAPAAEPAGSSSRSSSGAANQPMPEGSEAVHGGLPSKLAAGARAAKPRQQAKPRPLVVPEVSLTAAAAPAASSAPTPAAATAAVKQVLVQKCSMFDFSRPKGYTFSTAKARAAAQLVGAAEQPAAQQAQADAGPEHGGQQEAAAGSQTQAAAAAAGKRQSAAAASAGASRRSAVRPQGPGTGAAPAARADATTAGCTAPTAVPGHKQPAVSASAAAAAGQNQQQASTLQEEASFSSQRSHGLSLRRHSRQHSRPAEPPAAPVAAAASRERQRQGPPAVTHTGMTPQSAAADVVSDRPLQLQALAAKRRAGAASRGDRTTGGTVAAVAAVKAALAGFGTRGWQQQDVCEWLGRMRLDLLPEEPSQPLLANPLRNGLLLAGIASALTLQPLPGIFQPVSTLAAARANLLAAAARLSLVSTRFACAAAAAAARRDKAQALGLQDRDTEGPCFWDDGPGLKGQGIMPRAGAAGGLVCSPVRRARGSAAAHSPIRQRCRSRSASPNRSYQQGSSLHLARPGSGGSGVVLDDSSTCGCFVAVATGPGVHASLDAACSPPVPSGGQPAQGLCAPASSCCCGCWACVQLDGTMLEHAVLQLLELVMAGDTSCMWGLLYALQQSFPLVPDKPPACRDGRGRHASPNKQLQRQQDAPQQQGGSAATAATRGAAVSGLHAAAALSSSSACTVVQPLQGPSWRGFQLGYTADEQTELEQQLLQWLASLDLIAAGDTPDWSCICSDLASGVLLAEVAAAVGAGTAVGIQERPVTAAARASNVQAALDVLQHVLPGLSRRLLQQHQAALLAGERPALTALLEAVWVWATGQHQQGPWLRWAQQQQQQQQPAGRRAGSSSSSSTGHMQKPMSSSSQGRGAGASHSRVRHVQP